MTATLSDYLFEGYLNHKVHCNKHATIYELKDNSKAEGESIDYKMLLFVTKWIYTRLVSCQQSL